MRAVPIRRHCLLRLNKQDSWNLRNASNATAWILLLSFKVLEPNLSLVKEERWLFPRIDFRDQSCILSMDVPTYGNCCLFVFLLWKHCKIRKMALQLLCQKTTNLKKTNVLEASWRVLVSIACYKVIGSPLAGLEDLSNSSCLFVLPASAYS